MAIKYYTSIDLNGNELINAKAQNAAIAPATPTEGTFYFDTTINRMRYYDGNIWRTIDEIAVDTVNYRGSLPFNVATAIIPEPGGSGINAAEVGDMFVFSTGGTLNDPAWLNIDGETVQSGDFIIVNDNDEFDIIQGNIIDASDTEKGIVELATQAEVDSGAAGALVVTAERLQSKLTTQKYTKGSEAVVDLLANTPLTIQHNLDRALVTVITFDSSGNEINLEVVLVDNNNITIESTVALTGVQVLVVG